ncbi:MAG: hypothetical protein OXE77_00580 [Flavobacteriaceae bacterium]|nr:hypothetical protein [Flavobacteriaceae bacterium]MCY4266337.1 hypothetical protein [Flavobacteriaceae bacterium]MCY4299301.1 hypothetical protein [Flavobacteriaceae bacterium]
MNQYEEKNIAIPRFRIYEGEIKGLKPGFWTDPSADFFELYFNIHDDATDQTPAVVISYLNQLK